MIDIEKLETILPNVQKPARYTGGELGEIKKNIDSGFTRFVFCFPDVYEVGMSHMGTKILYHIVNNMTGVYAQRCFSPWMDMESELKNADIPLYSLETKTPLYEFDMVGINLSYEMCYTNVLGLLKLGRIPIFTKDRTDDMPIVIGGGGCAYNPEPLADFIDLFVIGEGEEVLPEIISLYKKCKTDGLGRREFLKKACGIQGVYVPSLYEVSYNNDNTIKAIPILMCTAPLF